MSIAPRDRSYLRLQTKSYVGNEFFSTWSQTTRRSLATNRTGAFHTRESRFLSTSQVILYVGAVPYPMELPPYPIDSYRLVNAYGLVFIACLYYVNY